jgi:ferredoxin
MAFIITDECIMCDLCVAECPENAIVAGDPLYEIDPNLCNDCGNCAEVCPVEACVPEDEVE